MRIQKYVLLFTAAIVTFLVGWSAYTGYSYLGSLLFPVSVEMPAASSTILPADVIATAEFSGEQSYETAELNLTGEYYLFEETLTKGFHDFDRLEIQTHFYDAEEISDNPVKPIPPKGFLQAKKKHNFMSVSVSPAFFTFETESIRGLSYRFIGKYYGWRSGADEDDVDSEIRGVLMKLEKGRVIAKMDVTLIQGGC